MSDDGAPLPPVSRSKRLAATIASAWGRTAVTMVVGLSATPVLLRHLGSERYGAAMVATQWFAYLDFLTFGLGAAVSVLLLRAATTGAGEGIPGTVRAGLRLMAGQLKWVLPGAAILVVGFPFALRLPPPLRSEFYSAAPAVLLSVLLFPAAAFRYVADAKQQGYLTNAALTVQAAVAAAAGVGLAVSGAGLTGQLWAGFLGAVACAFAAAYFAGATRRAFWTGTSAPLDRADVWKLQWPLLVVGMGNQINLLSDALLVGMLLSVKAVAGFFITQRLLQFTVVVGGSLNGGGTWAALVDLRARAGPERFRERLAEVSKLNIGVNLLVLAPALGLNRRFVSLWVGPEHYAGNLVMVATFVFLAVFNWFCLYAALLDSFGLTRRRVWVSTTGTLVKVALLLPFINWFGVAGVPLAGVAGYLLTDAWFCPLALCREQGVPGWEVAPGVLRAIALGGGWATVCYWLGNREGQFGGWTGLAVEAAGLEFGSLILAWFLLFSPTDRDLWRRRVTAWLCRPTPSALGTIA